MSDLTPAPAPRPPSPARSRPVAAPIPVPRQPSPVRTRPVAPRIPSPSLRVIDLTSDEAPSKRKRTVVTPTKSRSPPPPVDTEPRKPKSPLGPQLYFDRSRKKDPTADTKKPLGAAWKELDSKAKKSFFVLAEIDRQRYNSELRAYKAYLDAQASSPTDLRPPGSK